MAGGAVILSSRGGADPSPPTTTTVSTTTTAPTTTTTAAPPPTAPLTGLTGVTPARRERPAVMVKIDNAPQARPQSGLVQADIVFEERVEGNTSRFAAVFHSRDALQIGPVRSTRSTDMGFLPLFGRMLFASSGGSAPIIGQLHERDVIDVGHNAGGPGFYRAGDRPAPHNLFTGLRELYLRTAERPAAPKQVFRYRSAGEQLPDTAKPAKGVALSFGGGEIVRFVWDPPSKQWHRYHGPAHHLDKAGVPIAPANVVVMEMQYEFSRTTGNSQPHGVSTGSGRALVYTAGHVIGGRWIRPTVGDRLLLLDSKGREIELTPGQTFVETPPPGGFRKL
jgi:hypothetical protein